MVQVSLAQEIIDLKKEAKSKTEIEEEVEVVLGIDKNIELDFVPDRQIQIGSRAIVETQPIIGRKEITLKGLKFGKTNVTLRDVTGTIRKIFKVKVTTNPQSKILQDIRSFLDGVEGVEIKIIGDTITLTGHVVIPEDIGKISYVLTKHKEVVNMVELSPHSQRVIARKMQEEIHSVGLKNVTVRVLNKLFILEGIVRSKTEADKAMKIATIYLPDDYETLSRRVENSQIKFVVKDPIQDFIVIDAKKEKTPLPKLVKITAQFVELTKSFSDIFGFKWSPLLAGTGGSIKFGKGASGAVTTQSEGSLTGTISHLFPKLSSAKNAGHARILQSGIIIVKDKFEASLEKTRLLSTKFSTGEYTNDVHNVQGGFALTVKPEILQDEFVKMNISLNSDTVSAKGTAGSSETLKNKVKTELLVKSRESAVIGGVFSKKNETQYDKDPPGGDTQVEGGVPLFSFLRSKSQIVSKSQFVMFITPEIISSASSGTEEIKRKFRRGR